MQGLAKIGIYISETRAAKMVKAFDRTGDGRLHYHEFVRLLTATRAEAHEEKTASAPPSPAAPAPAPAPAAAEPEPEPEVALVPAGTEEGGAAEVAEESISDVLAAISYSVYSQYRGTRKAFGAFETSGDKQVSEAEMASGLKKAGVDCTEAELSAIYAKFDKDENGALSFSEFIKMLAAVEVDD